MYNLTFDTPYDRDIVSKLRQFRNVQEKYYTPTFVQPEHIVHHYDPVTITGGSRFGLPADLFEPRYTLNRNQMVGNQHPPMCGGSSDLMRPISYPPVRYDRRRQVKEEMESSSSSSESDGEGDVKQKLRRLQKIGGKKAEKKERKPSNRLLKIFN
jgi:hypothetical protein